MRCSLHQAVKPRPIFGKAWRHFMTGAYPTTRRSRALLSSTNGIGATVPLPWPTGSGRLRMNRTVRQHRMDTSDAVDNLGNAEIDEDTGEGKSFAAWESMVLVDQVEHR